jgi:hypothetical protein
METVLRIQQGDVMKTVEVFEGILPTSDCGWN